FAALEVIFHDERAGPEGARHLGRDAIHVEIAAREDDRSRRVIGDARVPAGELVRGSVRVRARYRGEPAGAERVEERPVGGDLQDPAAIKTGAAGVGNAIELHVSAEIELDVDEGDVEAGRARGLRLGGEGAVGLAGSTWGARKDEKHGSFGAVIVAHDSTHG